MQASKVTFIVTETNILKNFKKYHIKNFKIIYLIVLEGPCFVIP